MCIFLFCSADIIFSTLTKNTRKKFKLKKRLEIKNFLAAPVLFLTKIVYNLFFINHFFAQITFSYSLLRGLLVQKISKFKHQNSNHNWLLNLQK